MPLLSIDTGVNVSLEADWHVSDRKFENEIFNV